MKMSNPRNRIIYRLWAPVYDNTVGRIFRPGRRRAMQVLNLKPDERVLLPGVGTGEDLGLLPEGIFSIGVDLSPDMLAKARLKFDKTRTEVMLVRGDAQHPPVKPESCDAVVLNLILSVVPDGRMCLEASLKALKPGGRAVIFDKFLSPGNPSLARRFFNVFSTLLGTDINRRLADMLPETGSKIVHDEASIGGGMYRVILIVKSPSGG